MEIPEPNSRRNVTWISFPETWREFFQAKTKREFTYAHVNGTCAVTAKLFCQFLHIGCERYGFFYGNVTNLHWKNKDVVRHGWLELPSGIIIDPTRWCFIEAFKYSPMLAVCPAESPDYDPGMRNFKDALGITNRPMPKFTGPKLACAEPLVMALFNNEIDKERIFWLANLNPNSPIFMSEAHRVTIFRWLENNGYEAYIPWDNRVQRSAGKSRRHASLSVDKTARAAH